MSSAQTRRWQVEAATATAVALLVESVTHSRAELGDGRGDAARCRAALQVAAMALRVARMAAMRAGGDDAIGGAGMVDGIDAGCELLQTLEVMA